MSMNLFITIDGEHIKTIHTKTKETSMILGVDVDTQNENGFHNGFHISSVKDPEAFQECLQRFKQFVFEKTIEFGTIDHDGVESFFKIRNAISFIEFNDDMTDAIVKEVKMSFL